MKLIIAGSRTLDISQGLLMSFMKLTGLSGDHEEIWTGPLEIVSGGCNGIDKVGEEWAKLNDIPVKRFLADWEKFGTSAGPRRNKQMAEYANVLFLIWDGQSKGSRSMRNEMLKLNKPVYEVIIRKVT